MNTRRLRGKNRKSLFRRHRFALIATALTASLLLIVVWATLRIGLQEVDEIDSMEAVLIDQLSPTYPNNSFYFTANAMFHENGWVLRYIAGMQIFNNVDSYRSFPAYQYKIIILRAHTAIERDTNALAIFTSEEFSDVKASTTYLLDIINQRLVRVRVTSNSTAYFGITPDFVRAMNGDFNNAIIIVMGCDGLTNTKMAKAFIDKGAKAYIGWTGLVSADHTDAATQLLLRHLVADNQPVQTAVSQTTVEIGNDPSYGSTLSFYEKQA